MENYLKMTDDEEGEILVEKEEERRQYKVYRGAPNLSYVVLERRDKAVTNALKDTQRHQEVHEGVGEDHLVNE